MKEKVKPFLKTDVLATIGSDGLMGDKLITINSGSANEVRLLTNGARIMTANPVDFDKVISQFTNVAGNAEIITRELAGMAVQIRQGNGTISKLLYTDDLSRSLEATADNARNITGSMAGIASEIRSGRGSLGSLIYTDSLSSGLEHTVATATASMLTIQSAANGFGENMNALKDSYFLRGYFKRQARAAREDSINGVVATVDMDPESDMDEAELEEIIKDAQKALDARRKKK
jgi:phospholipid/cholesterol/gamma-HCH transport system substrate-binding protein